MKYAVLFLLLAATSLVATIELLAWTQAAWLGLWGVLAFGVISSAYARSCPALLHKRSNGVIPGWSWLMLAPYHLLNGLTMRLARLGGPVAYHEIAPGLWLGRLLTAKEARQLIAKHKIRAVLDLTSEFSEASPLRRLDYLSLPVLDKCPPSPSQLRQGLDFLERASGPVYVHCALGHGRSATFVVAHLARQGDASLEKWEARVRSCRPGVRLAPAQRECIRSEKCGGPPKMAVLATPPEE
ncbi:dual specificity protein phosphatase family protein [bacterium]|nr:dual specificity protein phosphatase family protein [bacterium]